MTTQLYLKDCYLKEFNATVLNVSGNKVVLDQTAFYAEAGGQPTDKGKIMHNGMEYAVTFVKKDQGLLWHELDKGGLKEGDAVRGIVDWQRRHHMMRSHTASHVFSGVIFARTGSIVTGNQIAEDKIRIDFNLENFDKEIVVKFAEEANKIIAEHHPVHIIFLPREEAVKIPTVTKLAMGLPPAVQEIRIIDITGFEKEACGGTHVQNTSEIGRIEIISTENKGKDNRRIYFKII